MPFFSIPYVHIYYIYIVISCRRMLYCNFVFIFVFPVADLKFPVSIIYTVRSQCQRRHEHIRTILSYIGTGIIYINSVHTVNRKSTASRKSIIYETMLYTGTYYSHAKSKHFYSDRSIEKNKSPVTLPGQENIVKKIPAQPEKSANPLKSLWFGINLFFSCVGRKILCKKKALTLSDINLRPTRIHDSSIIIFILFIFIIFKFIFVYQYLVYYIMYL